MTDNGVEQKPSDTALFAALRRTIANKEFGNEMYGPDYLAEKFLPPHFRFFLKFKKIRANTKERLNEFLPGLNEYMIARTAYFDHLFVEALKDQTSQVVFLGAGYDTRAYRFANLNHGTRIFELDIAPTQDRKRKCIKSARLKVPEFLTFIPIDFNHQSLADVLGEAGYQSHLKTLFIWEGVSYYLDAASVDRTFEIASKAAHPESSIAFDYIVSISKENIDDYYGVKEFSQTMREQHPNEDLLFSIDEGEIESFLEQRGLRVVEYLNNDDIEKRYFMDEEGSMPGQITGHFCFALASRVAG